MPGFNPRARTGRDAAAHRYRPGSLLFQSTRPHGARHAIRQQTARALNVSIHAPARGATLPSRPCHLRNHVSIHAPARGATRPPSPKRRVSHVSIHAPARGATADIVEPTVLTVFQSTRPHGARPQLVEHAHCSALVSIHAPARGATPGRASATMERISFNPRARTGRDSTSACHPSANGSFNPRARTGRDKQRMDEFLAWTGFNPRARTGRD